MVEKNMSLFGGSYNGRRVLVTGHTGFKGSWLAVWLSEMGADVTCLALAPESTPNHWEHISRDSNIKSHVADITNLDKLRSVVTDANPEIIFHLAAQSLVRRSYKSPLETWDANIMGAAHLLEICRELPDLRAVVLATTDKCYENTGREIPYRETDHLGGHDPYSASKAAMEILISSYRRAFFEADNNVLIASVRAGNVIGGGDWSEDRIIPDIVRAVHDRTPLQIRAPQSIRPWQHVLDCLSGYLMLGQKLLNGESDFASAWNFGPSTETVRTVEDILTRFQALWPDVSWDVDEVDHVHESTYLTLDSTKAHNDLNWNPVWDVDQAIEKTALWYKNFYESKTLDTVSQISTYIEDACSAGLDWAK